MFLSKIINATRGNVALITALLAPILVASTGGIVDISLRLNAEQKLQALLDSAVLAGVSMDGSEPDRMQSGIDFFDVVSAELSSTPVVSWGWDRNRENPTLTAEASLTIQTIFLGIIGISDLNVRARSAATTSRVWGDGCWMSMDEHRAHTIELHDSVKIEAPNCHFYGNSDHSFDVVDLHSCTNVLNARMVQSVGGGHHAGIDQDHCRGSLTDSIPSGVFLNAYVIADPIGHNVVHRAMDLAESCSNGNSGGNRRRPRGRRGRGGRGGGGGSNQATTVITQDGTELSPQTFCGQLHVRADTRFLPGTYYFHGDVKFDRAEIVGDGVTFVFADDISFEWKDSQIILSAPTDGDLAGMAILGLNDSDSNRIRNSLIDIQGVIYMPLAKIDWTNSRSNEYRNMGEVQHNWTAWIVEGAKWRGTGTVYFNFPEGNVDPTHRDYEGYPRQLMNILPESNNLTAHLVY